MTQSLYDKYRPTKFDQVVGQDSVVKSLKGSLERASNRTYMLVGPSGTGKTTLARIAARTLGYQVTEIDAATYTGIDNMREVLRNLNFKPLDSTKGKVMIVDECHRLSGQAWDSMLKTLEEPPAWVRWFLCTTDPAKVPKAVQTRCTSYTLKPVPVPVLFDLLDKIAGKEQILGDDELGGKILNLCARQADGSPRQALVNLDACMSATSVAEARDLLDRVEKENAEAVELARALLGGKSWSQVTELLALFADKDAEGVRHVVRAYTTKVVLSKPKPDTHALRILESFCKPFYPGDGKSPLVLACAEVLFGN